MTQEQEIRAKALELSVAALALLEQGDLNRRLDSQEKDGKVLADLVILHTRVFEGYLAKRTAKACPWRHVVVFGDLEAFKGDFRFIFLRLIVVQGLPAEIDSNDIPEFPHFFRKVFHCVNFYLSHTVSFFRQSNSLHAYAWLAFP
jgi:hypothetical protein